MTGVRRPTADVLLAALLVGALAACGSPILARAPTPAPPSPPPTATVPAAVDPQPIVLPRDEAPHRRLTEWWYYTGHLRTDEGREYGFEYVIFRAERGDFPVSWASHLALTDEAGDRFLYDQRAEIGPQVDLDPGDQVPGFELELRGDPSTPGTSVAAGGSPWAMRGREGRDTLAAHSTDFGLDLVLDDGDRSVALHDRDGWIDFGPAGGSYYYSRTRMDASGSLTIGDVTHRVTGLAWFDHQWGDFIAVGGGGWDWFAMNLEDGTDLTLSLVRDQDGSYPLVYGTLVRPDGRAEHLPREAFTVEVTGRWRSERTGADYPAGWRIALPAERLTISLVPTVADQELDTRPTTGVVYWEGSQEVTATRDGRSLGGEAYVELTGYGRGTGTIDEAP